MKATVDIPDPLYRQVKARAALQGRAVRDVTIELYERWLTDAIGTDETTAERGAQIDGWLREWTDAWAEVDRTSVGDRSALEILLANRR